MTAGITTDTMGNPKRMTRNYGTNTQRINEAHTEGKQGARSEGEGEKTKANAQIDCCFCGGVAQLSERER